MKRLFLTLVILASSLRAALPLSDTFGYSASAGSFAWTDISGSGVLVNPGDWSPNADDGSIQINLPFNFRFYGVSNTKVYLTTNGYLQFGSIGPISFAPGCLGINTAPLSIAAAYWMDLNPGAGGTVTYEVLGGSPNQQLVIQFTNVPPQLGSGTVTFQVILNEDHSFKFQYLSTSTHDSGASAVSGLRSVFDCPNRNALPLSCQTADLLDGLAIDIAYPAGNPGCGSPTVTQTFSVSPTRTRSPTRTHTPTVTPTFSDTSTTSPTPTVTETFTDSPTSTASPTETVTFSASPTDTDTPTETITFSASPTDTDTPSETPSFSASPTDTDTPTETPTYSATPSGTGTPTETPSDSPSPTDTSTQSETPTISDTPSISPTHTDTGTITPSSTLTPSSTRTSTPTHTPTVTPSDTRTITHTSSATPTHTPTSTATPTLFPPAPKPACLVLGQPDFNGTAASSGLAGMDGPGAVALDTRFTPFKAYVADTASNRVLIWNDASSLVNGSPADGFIGDGISVTASSLYSPQGLAVDSATGDLWVADTFNSRVLRFSYPIPLTGAAASRVLGQGGSFSSSSENQGGLSASSLRWPTGLSIDPFGRLLVADSGNHRVLQFNAPAGSAAADLSWGQFGSMSSGFFSSGPQGLRYPRGVLLLPDGIWVADTDNHRVLYFSTSLPMTQSASIVLGQPSFFGGSANQGSAFTNDQRLNTPGGLAMDGAGRLLVADTFNNRVVAFEPPFDNVADRVWGQATLGSMGSGAGSDNMYRPYGVAANGATLFVADMGNNRAIIYGCGAGLQPATQTVTRTPTLTVTCTSTISPTSTPSSTRSPSFSPSPSFSITPTFSVTVTISFTPTKTVTPSTSATSTVSLTPSRTQTPTITMTWSLTTTLSPTETPFPSVKDAVLAYPNPSTRASGRVCFAYPPTATAGLSLQIYDFLGQPVAKLDLGLSVPGNVCWDLRAADGQSVAPGLYYVRLLADGVARLNKFTVQ